MQLFLGDRAQKCDSKHHILQHFTKDHLTLSIQGKRYSVVQFFIKNIAYFMCFKNENEFRNVSNSNQFQSVNRLKANDIQGNWRFKI